MVRITNLLLIVAPIGHSGSFLESNKTNLLMKYKTNLNSSIQLEKEDRALRNSWMVDLQVKRIDVTTKYRFDMTRHKEHCFQRSDANEKWSECMYLHRRQIRKSAKDYYANESECLTTTTLEDKDRTKDVKKVEKEIRKWRKRYRRLVKLCRAENPDDEVFQACFVEYMEKDNFIQVIQRLIILKLEAMGQLYIQLTSSLPILEECLRTQLSIFLERVRLTMDSLNICYALKMQEALTI